MRARLPSWAMVRAPLAVLLALAGLGHALAPERADWAEQLDRLNRFKIGDNNKL